MQMELEIGQRITVQNNSCSCEQQYHEQQKRRPETKKKKKEGATTTTKRSLTRLSRYTRHKRVSNS